jgi:DEAD/DEAH box helicase domain-containing protein
MRQIILDVETQKTFDEVGGYFPDRLGISFVGICIRDGFTGKGEMMGFFEQDLPKLFPLLEQADVVVGFNCDSFDMQTFLPYYSADITKIPTIDVMMRIKKSIGHRLSLDSVATETLGIGKSGNGLDAIKYFKNKMWDDLSKYCLQDVAITRDVYDYGLKHGKIKFKNKWNRLIECPVDFTFTPKKDAGMQMSLL